jgi:hypothetical protein
MSVFILVTLNEGDAIITEEDLLASVCCRSTKSAPPAVRVPLCFRVTVQCSFHIVPFAKYRSVLNLIHAEACSELILFQSWSPIMCHRNVTLVTPEHLQSAQQG